MWLLTNRYRLAALMTLMLVFLLVGCESDADLIRQINEAERARTSTPISTPTVLSAEIATVEIQDGDCINSTIEEGITIETVVIMPCSGPWQYRVLSSFTVTGFDRYPGKDGLLQLADQRCDRHHTYILYPLFESWTLGDKTVNCLQHSFGLSTSNPAKLDRLVSTRLLNVGECFNEAPETDGLLVELVDCSGSWDGLVVSIFAVARDGSFPGEAYFQNQADEHCRILWGYYFFPSAETWQKGDRDVICARIREPLGT